VTGVPGAAGGGNFIEQLLRDVLRATQGASGADRLELARGLATQVATEGQPEGNVDPVQRIRFEELVRVAELHVAELTGLSPTPGGAPLTVTAVGPGAWAQQTVGDWRFVLDTMTATPPAAPTDTADDDGTNELMALVMTGMGPMFAALQLGSAIGHLATNTFGQYDVPIPRPAPAGILVVPANVDRFAADWGLELDQVRLWVCLREVTMHAVLGRPHVADRLRTLLTEVLAAAAGDAMGMVERLQRSGLTDPDALQELFTDPEALMAAEPTPERRRASEQLMAVTAALLGYVEHVLDQTATRLLGGRGALAEAWRRRQVDREAPARMAEVLFGLDLGPGQVDRGTSFVRGVVERAGDAGLARLWSGPETLPTPAEVDAPGLWLERISFSDDRPES